MEASGCRLEKKGKRASGLGVCVDQYLVSNSHFCWSDSKSDIWANIVKKDNTIWRKTQCAFKNLKLILSLYRELECPYLRYKIIWVFHKGRTTYIGRTINGIIYIFPINIVLSGMKLRKQTSAMTTKTQFNLWEVWLLYDRMVFYSFVWSLHCHQ